MKITRRMIVERLAISYEEAYGLAVKWEGEGPHDFNQGSARAVCMGLYYDVKDADKPDSGPVKFTALFGKTAEEECRTAHAMMTAGGILDAVIGPRVSDDDWWTITFEREIPAQ